MRLEASTIEELFEAAERRADDLREVDRIIVDTAPDLKRYLFRAPSVTMLGYGELPYSGDAGDGSGVWPLLGLTAQKRHIALYVAAQRDGVALAEYYRDRLGKTNNGKGCIRFTRLANIDTDQLAHAVRDAIAWSDGHARDHR